MASLVCKYCGSYLNDSDEVCPNCGAVNENYRRLVDKTPKTIEELKGWYKARKLPPEETTRFFIGKNIKAPRAFGIYEDNGRFIVYKNKSDGSRAIRYEGRDEAYAVNEIYLRLKEEILNQKKHNANKGNKGRHPSNTGSNFKPTFRTARNDNPQGRNYTMQDYPQARNTNRNNRHSLFFKPFISLFLMMSILLAAYGGLSVGLSKMSNGELENFINSTLYDEHHHFYYVGSDGRGYFLDGYDSTQKAFSWWVFDETQHAWVYYQSYPTEDSKTIIGPDVVDLSTGTTSSFDFQELYDNEWATKSYEEFAAYDITTNHAFIDAGHHYDPINSYYCYDGQVYYYLNDEYSGYGSGSDDSGWYIYTDNGWAYYCGPDDKEVIGDDLWYHDGYYFAGTDYIDIYSYVDEYSTEWNATDFSDTEWYSEYKSDYDAWQDWVEKPSWDSGSSYDDDDYDWDYDYDSDWDWDSGSDWDSGYSDWDSDW